MIIFSYLALALAQPADVDALPSVAPEVQKAISILGECLARESLVFEPTDASFEDIFLAAKTECAMENVQALNVLQADFGRKYDQSTSADYTLRLLESFEGTWKNQSRLDVLKARLRRKSNARNN